MRVIASVFGVEMEMGGLGQKRKYRVIRGIFETFSLWLVCFKNKRNGNSTRFEYNLHRRYRLRRRRRRRNRLLHQLVLMVNKNACIKEKTYSTAKTSQSGEIEKELF